jgi:flagellar motor switch protein FliM
VENILTQEEIDALMKGISSGEIPTEGGTPPAEPDGVRPYDFTRHDSIVQGKIPAVEVMIDRFAHQLTGTFTSAFRRMVEVTPVSSEVKKFRDFLKGLPMPTSIHLFRLDPHPGMGLLVLEANLVYLLIEFIMGGSWEGQLKIEGRDFTNIENRLIRRVVKDALRDLEKAWNVLQPVQVEFERSEINPQFAAVLLPSDRVLCVHLDVQMEMASGTLILCLPFASVEPFRDRLSGLGSERESKERLWMEHMVTHVLDAPMTLSVELGSKAVTVQDILNLEAGQLLSFDNNLEGFLPVKVEGVTRFTAHPGHANGRKAVRVVQVIHNDPIRGAEQSR